MAVTASMVKELRERTGAGMMECKKALVQAGGDMEAALELLRVSGLAQADKKAGRIAAEGRITLAGGDGETVMVEVNCETDFVAKDESFNAFARAITESALGVEGTSVETLMAASTDGRTVEEARQALVAKLGENIQVRRIARMAHTGTLGSYVHAGRIGVLVDLDGGDAELARDLAMHIAALNPEYISKDDVPADVVAKEKDILKAQAQDSGKPPEIVEKMVSGRLQKHLGQITLLGQAFVKDPDVAVGELLRREGARVIAFVRLAVGEGIEKKEESFAEEVMQQVTGS